MTDPRDPDGGVDFDFDETPPLDQVTTSNPIKQGNPGKSQREYEVDPADDDKDSDVAGPSAPL